MSLKVQSGSESNSHSEFAKLLAAWADAIVAGDAERIAAFAEPDWIITGPEGGPGRLEGFLAVVRSGELTHSEMSFRVLEARVFGDVAVVLAHGTNKGTWRGHAFAADEWVTEVFVRRPEGWRCTMTR